MSAKAATSEALWDMKVQMLASKSSLVGQRMHEEEQCAAT